MATRLDGPSNLCPFDGGPYAPCWADTQRGRSEIQRGEWPAWLGEEVSLEQIAAEFDQDVALFNGLDPFRDYLLAHVLAEPDYRSDDLLLSWNLVDIAHEAPCRV